MQLGVPGILFREKVGATKAACPWSPQWAGIVYAGEGGDALQYTKHTTHLEEGDRKN
jgi:hypothetical protein